MGRIHTLYDITAPKVPSTAVGNLSSTNVQDALAELDTEKEVAGTAATTLSGHLVDFNHANIPSTDEKGALAGTNGTPSAANPFVTTSDPRLTGSSSTSSGAVRERLTAHRTYYVRTDGNDNNDGLADVSSRAFLTIQKAVDVVCKTLDLGGYDVTLQLGDGTYTTKVVLGAVQGGVATLVGNISNPANTLLSVTNGIAIQVGFNSLDDRYVSASSWVLRSFRVSTITSGNGIEVSHGNVTMIDMQFGAVAGNAIAAYSAGAVYVRGTLTLAGNALHVAATDTNGLVYLTPSSFIISGTPTWSGAFARSILGGVIYVSGTVSGASIGTRYFVSLNGGVTVNGAGVDYLPGSLAGSTSLGGQYA